MSGQWAVAVGSNRAVGCALLLMAVSSGAATFEEQRKAIASSPATQPEAVIQALLKAGLDEGKPVQAIAEAQKWLRQNLPQDPSLLYDAARAAELSGDWKGAAALYQQYLAKADLTSASADEAAYAAYTLLIERLGDLNGAYAFARNEGGRLLVCPRARQFDKGFLDEAMRRQDATAVAGRLKACIAAGLPAELLTALYGPSFRWLLGAVDGYCDHGIPVTQDLYDAVKDLCDVLTHDEELKLRLDWAVSVKAYNMAKLGDQAKTKVARRPAGKVKAPSLETAKKPSKKEAGKKAEAAKEAATQGVEEKKLELGEEIDPPIAEATALLEKYPRLVLWVMTGWAGGGNGPYYRGDPRKYWPQEAEAKMAPILAALSKLTPAEAADFLYAAAYGNYVSSPSILDLKPVQDYLKANPAVLNFRNSVVMLGKEWNQLTPEEAQKLAPSLAQTGHPSASLVRAIAAGGKDYDKVIAALLGPEAWRLGPGELNGPYADQLWHYCGRPGGNQKRDEGIAKSKALAATLAAGDAKKGDPAEKRIAAFKRLWNDYRSAQPKIPAVRARAAAVLKCTPEVVPELLKDPDPEAQRLVREAGDAGLENAKKESSGREALTPAQAAWADAADPKLVCKGLLSLTNTSDVATVAAALQSAIAGVRKSPVRMEVTGLDQLGTVTSQVFADPKVYEQVLLIADALRDPCRSHRLGNLLLPVVREKRDPVMLHRAANYLWSHCYQGPHRDPFPAVRQLGESLLDDHPSAASAMARIGLAYFSGAKGDWSFNPVSDVPALKTLQTKSSMKMGLMAIPVEPTDPAYPIYKAQADWLGGNEDSAWTLCQEHWSRLLPVHRELSMDYLMWVLRRTIYSREDARQEELIKALLAWSNEANTPLSPTQRAEIETAYGDIAIQRGMLKQAHELFTRTMQNKTYAGLPARNEAALRRVRVERMSKDFDAALQTLLDLEMERVPEMWSPLRYARAEVYYDMEEYDQAAKDIESILARDPTHAEAKIMQGKLQLKRQKLMEATEVELGMVSSQQALVPGEKLKVTLSDPTLAISGAGTEIEVVVWAASGDKERFFLRQFGDQKTKFRGEVATALGAPKPEDRILQVIGDDEVFYAYSERFRQKMNNLEEKRGGPIKVASDALLMASARKLLSEAEQRVADMEAQMAALQQKAGSSASALAGAQAQKAATAASEALSGGSAEEVQARAAEALQKRLLAERVKPGNPLYVRVIDPDRSRTAGIDEVTVSVVSSTGDSVGRVTLKETGTHTGWFEGSVPTAGAQAKAFAENSEPGRNPNMVISPLTDYPAWRPVASKGVTPKFIVDLNDNVALGELVLTAREQGSKLKKFALQTGMNAKEMTTVAAYPAHPTALAEPWRPSVTIMNDTDYHHVRDERSVYDLRELETQLDLGWLSQQSATGVAEPVSGPSEALKPEIPGRVKWLRNNQHHNAHVIYRFRGYFYEPVEVMRHFKVELGTYELPKNIHPSVAHPPQFMLAVDGRPITSKERPRNLEGNVQLSAGLHRFEIWATGWDCAIGFGRSLKLLANRESAETLTPCPDRFFDPATFPKGLLPLRNGAATIKASADGTTFNVAFAPGSRARLLRLVFVEQEGPVPAVNRLALTTPDGKRVLPVAQDFAALNKNDILEILTGDKVAVRYVDDRFVTKAKETHERLLDVSFTTAKMQFEFFEMRKDRNGEDVEYYEKLLRFVIGKPVLLTVMDADMDVSAKPDKVTVTLESTSGGKRQVVATETGDSTGLFRVWVTPVSGAPANEREIRVGEGEAIIALYRDAENTEPGVPTDRYATVQHAVFSVPELHVSHATVTPIALRDLPGSRRLNEGFASITGQQEALAKMTAGERHAWQSRQGGMVRPRWMLHDVMRTASAEPEKTMEAVLGQTLYVDVLAPSLALRSGSQVSVYVQTEDGRKQAPTRQPPAGATNAPAFDITVPGTLKLNADLDLLSLPFRDLWRDTPRIPIYVANVLERQTKQASERFRCSVPLIPGVLPDHGVLTEEEREARIKARRLSTPTGLVVKPGDRVHIGFSYTDRNGAEQWLATVAKVITHPVLDVMEEDYRSVKTNAFVGETLFLRVVDLGADVSDRSDTVSVLLQAKSGAKQLVSLQEVDTHSGVFKGAYPLSYGTTASTAATQVAELEVKKNGFPVVYGDTMGARYTDANGVKTETHMLTICKGADGAIEAFSKRYTDPEIAMRTQFTLSESYLEVAKHHRALGENEAAAREYERAKQMLASAIDQFRDKETRAHAEYLLGNLTLEEADATEEKALKEERYRAALSRFMNVTGNYPDTLHASKAQFKIATVYEKLKEADVAAQEYVKLAYKYPDSEFLATAMARLGAHFQRTAASYEARAKPLLEKKEDKDAQFEGAAQQKMAVNEYLKAANIFGRLQERFPDHELAGKAGLYAGQAYMRAGANRQAVNAFLRVIGNESYDGPEIRAQAMYWAGMCYEGLKEAMAAYSIYKRLTFDFPESKWASYARAQLSQEGLLKLESELEIKRLEEGR